MPDFLRDRIQRSLGQAYTLGRELGGGGMSRVFAARDESLGREVVVKVFVPDPEQDLSAARFAREIRFTARLQEPHIVPVLSAGTTADGLPYYTMPFVRGESLRARLRRGPLTLREAVGVLRDVAHALAYAHGQGVVHRDVKPENVLLSEGTAVVTDFGIAQAIVDSTAVGARGGLVTSGGASAGTPAYMSPEQAAGDPVDQRADLYSWGVMAFELLAGRHPFADKATAHQLLAAHLAEVPSATTLREAGVPDELVELVMRCLEKEPARRPATIAELLATLEAIASPPAEVPRPRHGIAAAMRHGLPLFALVLGLIVALAVMVRQRAGRASAGGVMRSVAVLPFVNIGGDSTDAYLAQGLADELAITLGRLPGMRVAPRASARVLHAQGLGPGDVSRALDVQGVLVGTMRRGGDRLRLSAELVDGPSGRRLWSDQFEEPAGDVFAVQDRITRAIVGALRPRLAGGAAPRLAAVRGTADPEAYDLYLRGRYFWGLRSEAGLRRAIGYFQRAVSRDSGYVLAISGLADAYAVSAFRGYVPPEQGYGRARELARRALRLDSTRAAPHASLGYVALYHDWDWPEAERQFRRAIELDDGYATAHQWYGSYHVAMRQPDAAIASLRTAQRADPLERIGIGALCWGLHMNRRHQEAVAECARAIDIDSTFATAWLWSGQAHAMLGDTAQAFRELEEAVRLTGRSAVFVAALAHARALAGQPDRARALLAELTPDRHGYVPSYEIALVHAALGDRDSAMEWLERAYRERSHSIAFLRVDPALDPLRGDPRFAALLARAGLG